MMANALMADGLMVPQINTMDEFTKGVQGSQGAQVNRMNIDNAKQQQYMQGLNTIAAGAAYATDPKTGQVDPTKWNEVVDTVAKSGADVSQFKDHPYLAPMLIKLSLTTQQQVANAQTQQQIDQAIAKYQLEVQQFMHPLPVKTSPGDTFNDPRTGNVVGGSGPQGGFFGTSTDQQALQILAKGDPSTYEYAQAYNQQSQPVITTVPDGHGGMMQMSTPRTLPQGTRPPTFKGQLTAAAPDAGAPPAAAPSAAPLGGAFTVTPNQVPAVGQVGQPDTPAPIGGAPAGNGTTMANGTTLTPLPGIKPPTAETPLRYKTISAIVDNEIPNIEKNFKDLSDPWSQVIGGIGDATGQKDLARAFQTPGYKSAYDSVTTVIQSVLYALSGSSSNPGEVVKQGMVLLPHINDDPETKKNAFNRLKTYILSVAVGTGDDATIQKTQQLLDKMNFDASGSGDTKGGPSPTTPQIHDWTTYGFQQ